MTRLVYLSPLPWGSFEQRPHKLVQWFHARTSEPVLWIEPYPTRFPRLRDLSRLRDISRLRPQSSGGTAVPPWLRVVRPWSLPIEPLPGSAYLNRALWHKTLAAIHDFTGDQPARLLIGKPSLMALWLLDRLPDYPTLYDAMDDFPNFYRGWSRRAMQHTEACVARSVQRMWTSSKALHSRWLAFRHDVECVPNALDPEMLPTPRRRRVRSPVVFGYVGTVAEWFDWSLVLALARLRPQDIVRIIGPLSVPPPGDVPSNVFLLPPCPHRKALEAMNDFDVGLIPFRRNALTEGVDPIKYYEYRAIGLPVLSTCFGDMTSRATEPGVYLVNAVADLARSAEQAVADIESSSNDFITKNSWCARFDATALLVES